MNKITIHYDYTDGTELSYYDGLNCTEDFNTNCLQFFKTDNDATIIKANGAYINSHELLKDAKQYGIIKEIRQVHNILKMFIAGCFDWRK